MGDQREGGIAWTDQTWNPVRGCSRVSEGCRNCYAEAVAARFSGTGQPYEGLATRDPGRWTGEVRLVEEHLEDPLRWRRPRRVFVNSMSDLFHERLPFEDIDRVFEIMAQSHIHTFQILTKRPARMLEWFTTLGGRRPIPGCGVCTGGPPFCGSVPHLDDLSVGDCQAPWPLPNVWLGVSVENQATADERIPLLLECPAAVRFLSVEPLLGPVDLDISRTPGAAHDEVTEDDDAYGPALGGVAGIDWVIVGGESGPGSRPMDLAWARSVVRQCQAAEVACFVKQLGARPFDLIFMDGKTPFELGLRDRKGGDIEEWPADLRVRQFPRSRP